jgi:hypothetical protein
MRSMGRLVGGSCFVALAVASGALAWAAAPDLRGAAGLAGSSDAAGVAGPLGPDAFSALPAYFKRVTFNRNQLGQYQDIAMKLPAGRYLVEVVTSHAPAGSRPDCAGVSFPLVPSVVEGRSFTGYVPVANDGRSPASSGLPAATRPRPTTCSTYPWARSPAPVRPRSTHEDHFNFGPAREAR